MSSAAVADLHRRTVPIACPTPAPIPIPWKGNRYP